MVSLGCFTPRSPRCNKAATRRVMYIEAQMTTAKINDIEMYYEVHGPTVLPADQADTLLLIMGLGANATSWEMQVPAFSREYRVVAFDNRGSGRTDKPKSPYTMHQMADDGARSEERRVGKEGRS